MGKDHWNRKRVYSIRKFTVGTCSVLIGTCAILFGTNLANISTISADETPVAVATENVDKEITKEEAVVEKAPEWPVTTESGCTPCLTSIFISVLKHSPVRLRWWVWVCIVVWVAAARTSFLVVIRVGVVAVIYHVMTGWWWLWLCGVVGVVCCLRTQECALFNTF